MLDVYFDPAYGKLYETIENGTCQCFTYESEIGSVQNMFIKRKVPFDLNGERYYDIVTPYGYGGPVAQAMADKSTLMSAYKRAFESYCKENRIVSEFIRFHPLLENALDCSSYCEVCFSQNTVALDLTDSLYEMTQFRPECRNMIRKAHKKGVIIRVDEQGDGINDFIALYYKTMEKNHAVDYYYFPKNYFSELVTAIKGGFVLFHALYRDTIIASSLFLLYDSYMHYHLSATDPEWYAYAANNLILSNAAAYGHKKGMKWLHLGGGITNRVDDLLFAFKRSFGKRDDNIRSFYIGKKIYNQQMYNILMEMRKADCKLPIQDSFFPVYRSGL